MRLRRQVVGVQRHRSRVERVDQVEEHRRPGQHREDRRPGQRREHHQQHPRPTGSAGQHTRGIVTEPAGRPRAAQPDSNENSGPRGGSRAPASGPPSQPHRDDAEGERQHQLEDPRRNPQRYLAAHLHFDRDDVDSGPGEQRRDCRAHRRGESLRHLPRRPLRNEGRGGQRDQLVLPRGEAGPQESDPQREVLDEGYRTRNAAGDDRPDDDLGQRQDRHRRQRAGGEQLFRPVEEPERGRRAARNGLERRGHILSSTGTRSARRWPRRRCRPVRGCPARSRSTGRPRRGTRPPRSR